MASAVPSRKVGLGAAAGALTILVVYGIKLWRGIDVPAEVAQGFTILVTFVTSYLVPNAAVEE